MQDLFFKHMDLEVLIASSEGLSLSPQNWRHSKCSARSRTWRHSLKPKGFDCKFLEVALAQAQGLRL